MGGILKILNLSEILSVDLVDKIYLAVAVIGDKYCKFRWVYGDLENQLLPCGKFAAVSLGIGKICRGKLWSLSITGNM